MFVDHQCQKNVSVHRPTVNTNTYTSFFAILFKSIPYSLAPMKCSLNAGISLMVAMQPSIDMQQLMTRGITGTGFIFYYKRIEVFLDSNILAIRNCVGRVNKDWTTLLFTVRVKLGNKLVTHFFQNKRTWSLGKQ